MSIDNKISFEAAQRLAREQAESLLCDHIESNVEVLDKNFFEHSEFWMFFRNKNLKFSSEASLPASAAYVVSKTGEVRIVADLLDDEVGFKKITDQLAKYFREK